VPSAATERTYHSLVGVYDELGYELVELTRAPVETRPEFVLAEAGLSQT
jgi:predicted ATPase